MDDVISHTVPCLGQAFLPWKYAILDYMFTHNLAMLTSGFYYVPCYVTLQGCPLWVNLTIDTLEIMDSYSG